MPEFYDLISYHDLSLKNNQPFFFIAFIQNHPAMFRVYPKFLKFLGDGVICKMTSGFKNMISSFANNHLPKQTIVNRA